MNEEDFTDMGFMVELSDDEVKMVYYAISEALRVWPGGEPRQQEQLENLKDGFFRLILEMQFDSEA